MPVPGVVLRQGGKTRSAVGTRGLGPHEDRGMHARACPYPVSYGVRCSGDTGVVASCGLRRACT